MKKVLLATSNKDKFKIVSYLLKRAGFSEEHYEILSLKDINYQGIEEKERGNIQERAKRKAISVRESIENYGEYEFIIGIDDGMELKGTMIENVKEYVNMILFEDYLEENESIIFPRAYCAISKDGDIYETIAKIGYRYKPNKNLKVEPNSYPLSQVAVPLNSDKALTEMSENEGNEYCWNCCKNEIIDLVKRATL